MTLPPSNVVFRLLYQFQCCQCSLVIQLFNNLKCFKSGFLIFFGVGNALQCSQCMQFWVSSDSSQSPFSSKRFGEGQGRVLGSCMRFNNFILIHATSTLFRERRLVCLLKIRPYPLRRHVYADQPPDALLVVVVALAFDDDLQQNKLDALKKTERGNYAPSCHGR